MVTTITSLVGSKNLTQAQSNEVNVMWSPYGTLLLLYYNSSSVNLRTSGCVTSTVPYQVVLGFTDVRIVEAKRALINI